MIRVASAAAIIIALSVPSAAKPELAPHHVVYDLSDQVTGVSLGELEFEFNGNKCSGYASITKTSLHSDQIDVSSINAVWESPGATSIRFTSDVSVDGEKVQSLSGNAERSADALAVTEGHASAAIKLPATTLFPSEYAKIQQDAMQDDKTVVSSDEVFLGSGTTATLITSVLTPRKSDPSDPQEFANLKSWRSVSSQFESGRNDATPNTTTTSVEFENGVISQMEIDDRTSGIVLIAKMRKLELLQAEPCEQEKAGKMNNTDGATSHGN